MDGAALETTDLPQFDLGEFVRRVLAEDLGSGGDVTSKATIDPHARFTAEMNCREPIVVAGLDVAVAFFRALDREVRIDRLARDGDAVPAGTVLLRLDGNARAMLAAERSALNTLQHLVGHRHHDAALCRRDRWYGRHPCSTLARPFPGSDCWKNMRRAWAARRTIGCGSMMAC